jgi:hypothetical protein
MKPHRSLKKTRCGSWRRAARLRSQMSWPVMSFLSFLSCLVLPCLALPCLAGLATGGSPPFPPCCSSPPRSSRPLDTRFLEPWHTRMCQSNSSTAASVPQILAKSNVWRSECQCVNLQWSLRFIPWASWFSADPISAFLRGSCSMATIPR